ncbi:MAG: hypothetical protein ACR2PZ_09570 [Pseudomonadales bacterium]
MQYVARIVRVFLVVLLALATAPSQASDADNSAAETAALAVLDRFIAAFSAKDAAAHVATYHFPHYRLARGSMSMWENSVVALQSHVTLFETLPNTGWDRSEWVERKVVTSSPSKVHIDTRFRRLRKDGSVIGVYDSLYVVIKRDGRWGIKLRSSFL